MLERDVSISDEPRLAILVIGQSRQYGALASWLSEAGYQVAFAESVQDAVRALQQSAYSLCMLDCQNTPVSGISSYCEIEDGLCAPRMPPVVALSSGSIIACHDRDCGFAAILRKPLKRDKVVKFVQGYMERGKGLTDAEHVCVDVTRLESKCPNRTSLQAFAGQIDPGVFQRMHQVFVEDSEQRLSLIDQALRELDWPLIEREAHALKSGALQVGADAMALLCEQMVAKARVESANGMEELFEGIRCALGDEQASVR